MSKYDEITMFLLIHTVAILLLVLVFGTVTTLMIYGAFQFCMHVYGTYKFIKQGDPS